MEINIETLNSLIVLMRVCARDATRKAETLRKEQNVKRSRLREAEGAVAEYEYILKTLHEVLEKGPSTPGVKYVLFIFTFKQLWERLTSMLMQAGALEASQEGEEERAYLMGRIYAHYVLYKTFLDERVH